MGRIIEGYWDCAYCGAKGILGRYRDCPSCGKPRGEDTVFYHDPPNEQNVVENPEEVSREADWHCEFCDSLNPASAKFCESCGSPRTDKTYFEMKEEHSRKEQAAQAIAAPPEGRLQVWPQGQVCRLCISGARPEEERREV